MTKRKNPRQTQPEFFHAGGPGTRNPAHPRRAPRIQERTIAGQDEFVVVSRRLDGSGWR